MKSPCHPAGKEFDMSMDVAAYIWPSYHDDPRSRIFWPQGMGEWQSVLSAKPKFEGHIEPRLPVWGPVNEADPYVMSMEIAAAADHGVNTFIYDWYWYDRRPFLEGCLNEGFLKAPNNNRMKFYLMWANHDATALWNKEVSSTEAGDTVVWQGSVDHDEFIRVMRRLTEKYFTHPLYYRLDDKPVFMIYDLGNLIKGLGSLEATRDAMNEAREIAKEAGLPGLHFQLVYWSGDQSFPTGVDGGNIQTSNELVTRLGFDSLTHYQFVHFTDPDRDYKEIVADAVREWERLEKEYSIPYYPHVSIGWDNNPRFYNFRPGIVKNNTPEAFYEALTYAREFAEKHGRGLVTINSWNEWTETSSLQPDNLYGYGYLEAVKKAFGPAAE